MDDSGDDKTVRVRGEEMVRAGISGYRADGQGHKLRVGDHARGEEARGRGQLLMLMLSEEAE